VRTVDGEPAEHVVGVGEVARVEARACGGRRGAEDTVVGVDAEAGAEETVRSTRVLVATLSAASAEV
jgi:hypothetical protein